MARWTREERVIKLAGDYLTIADVARTIAAFPETPTTAEIDRNYNLVGEREWSLSWARLMTREEEDALEAERVRKQQEIDEQEADDRKAGF